MENKLLREKIKELDIRIMDLAKYMEMSRPTIYKYIEMYETGHRNEIESKVLSVFEYIDNNENIGKTNVIKFILENISKIEENISEKEKKKIQIRNLLKHQNKTKEDFIYLISEDNFFDPILDYLIRCRNIADKKITEEEYEFIKPLEELYKTQGYKIKINKKRSDKWIEDF